MEPKKNPPSDDQRVNAISKISSKNATSNEKPAQAAGVRINAAHVSAFLVETMESELKKLTYYFGQEFSAVSAAEFEWLKFLSDTPLNIIVDVPFCHIPEDVYHILAKWIDRYPEEGLKSFVIRLFNSIMFGMETQLFGDSQKGAQSTSLKSQLHSRKALSRDSQDSAQNISSESQVEIFLMLSILLRRRPGVLISSLPLLSDDSKCRSQDKLPLFSWMIAQAAEGDITVGLYTWTRSMLPVLGGKSGSNPKASDLVLQVVERILSVPNAREVLCQGATRNGERLISNSALELLLRLSFPAGSAQVKETKRFRAIYSTLIHVALHASRTELNQVSQQIQPLVLKLAGEETSDLSQAAAKIFIWCLIQTPDCYNYWGKMYMSNLKASVVVLARLSCTWKLVSPWLSDLPTLFIVLKGFREQNKKACGGEGVDEVSLALIKNSDYYILKLLTKMFGKIFGWPERMVLIINVIAFAVGAILNLSFHFFGLYSF